MLGYHTCRRWGLKCTLQCLNAVNPDIHFRPSMWSKQASSDLLALQAVLVKLLARGC